MFQFQHTAMATVFEIRGTCADAALARHAARTAFEAVDRLEQMLSRFIENSDISRINDLAAGESTVVGYETMQVLRLAQAMHDETGAAFDPSIGTGFPRLELVPAEFRVIAHDAGIRLDLGAIGKGYAVDRVADVLEDWELPQVLVQAGLSSVLALDPPEGADGWPLTLSEPGPDGRVRVRMSARHCALGASGIQKGEHIIDGRDGRVGPARRAAWVSAPRGVLAGLCARAGVEASAAAVADALSTAFMISTVEDIEACCRRHPGMEAWSLGADLRHFPPHPSSE